jgi:hypothetical protein
MPPLKSSPNFKFQHFFLKGLVRVSKSYVVGSIIIGECNASPSSTTSVRDVMCMGRSFASYHGPRSKLLEACCHKS